MHEPDPIYTQRGGSHALYLDARTVQRDEANSVRPVRRLTATKVERVGREAWRLCGQPWVRQPVAVPNELVSCLHLRKEAHVACARLRTVRFVGLRPWAALTRIEAIVQLEPKLTAQRELPVETGHLHGSDDELIRDLLHHRNRDPRVCSDRLKERVLTVERRREVDGVTLMALVGPYLHIPWHRYELGGPP